jgi:signal transduction histidine kinase
MSAPESPRGTDKVRAFLWDLLTFERMMTGPVTHLIYWAGLGLILLIGFSIIGGAVGLGIRDGSLTGIALAFATLVAGLLVLMVMILVWRGLSEFYLAVFRIAEDLRALRLASEEYEAAEARGRASAPSPGAQDR